MSPELAAYLDTLPSAMILADCFTLTLANGGVVRWSGAGVPITFGDVTFDDSSILISGLNYKASVGLTVDEAKIKIAARPTDLLQGVPFMRAVKMGGLDGARIRRERAYLRDWASPAIGAVVLFDGLIAPIDSAGEIEAEITVKTDLVLLDRPYPRNTYQPSCRLPWGGTLCGVNKADHTFTGAVEAGATRVSVPWASATAGKFDHGTLLFTSGALEGLTFTIAASDGTALAMRAALPAAPATGDSFAATWGCDHTRAASGCGKFYDDAGVKARYGGEPYIPQVQSGL